VLELILKEELDLDERREKKWVRVDHRFGSSIERSKRKAKERRKKRLKKKMNMNMEMEMKMKMKNLGG